MGTALGIGRKVSSVALAIFFLISVNFLTFMVLQGDPVVRMIPHGVDQSLYDRIVDEARLDEPLIIQYVDYLIDTITGDFRVSASVRPSSDIQEFIWSGVGNSLSLLSLGLIGSLALGAVLEGVARMGRGRALAVLSHGLSLMLVFVPAFSLAIVVLMVNVQFDLGLPNWGDGTRPWDAGEVTLSSVLESALLPLTTVVLSTAGLATITLREGLRDDGRTKTMHGDRLAIFASGLVRLRPMTHFYVAWTMAAVLLTDIVFSYDGLGSLMVNALYRRDTPLLMAVTFLISMMVMASSSVVSLSIHAISGRPLAELLNDWGRRGPASNRDIRVATIRGTTKTGWLNGTWMAFKSSAIGMSAVIVLGIMVAMGVLAPVIGVTSDPSGLAELEPNNYPNWVNPLPPSLEPSPYTGIIHLFGTDPVGRDVYTMWLFGAREAAVALLIVTAGAVLAGLVVGLIALKTIGLAGPIARVLDLLLTAGARAMVAIPLLVYIAARAAATQSMDFSLLVMVLAFYAWAWVRVIRPVREKARAAGGVTSNGWMTPSILAESLSVAKFAVPLILATHLSANAIGMGTNAERDWGTMTYTAYSFAAPLTGDWHLIIPPLVGILVICAGAFVLLDRVEHAVRTTEPLPSDAA